jgi:4-hydroxy-tetrahydrodipicolinate reductase
MNPTRILLVGANGRMGREISEALSSQPRFTIAARCQRGDAIEESMTDVDVVIDVSHPDAAISLCAGAVQKKIPLVIGTTGHSAQQRSAIDEASRSVPIVFASNFSLGVNALFALTRRAGKILGREFKPKIIEIHHQMKKDAPSGTAKTIAQILRSERNDGAEVPIQSIREGDLVGEHTVIFTGPQERIELKHRAESREIFARGALRAAFWIVGKPAGLYSMEDVLGLSDDR